MGLALGSSLGHYNVTDLLGEGSMRQVWQATDTQLNRQVALKILPDAFPDDPDRSPGSRGRRRSSPAHCQSPAMAVTPVHCCHRHPPL